MRHSLPIILVLACVAALFLACYFPVLFQDRQFGFRDAGHFYYPLYQRVQKEWDEGRWPLWELEENAGMPLLGNPTAAVLYPGKLIFALFPYAWGARVYVVSHSLLAFVSMLVLMRYWQVSWVGSGLSALAYTFGVPILFQYCNIIYLVGAAWLPLGFHAVDRWARLGRRWGLIELSIVLAMQTLGGDPQTSYLLGLCGIGYAAGLSWSRRHSGDRPGTQSHEVNSGGSLAWWWLPTVVLGIGSWVTLTLILAQWLPTLRPKGFPPPALPWMRHVPSVVTLGWGVLGTVLFINWRWRGWPVFLGVAWLGWALAVLAPELLLWLSSQMRVSWLGSTVVELINWRWRGWPVALGVAWLGLVVVALSNWRWSGWRRTLGISGLGLAGSALLTVALSAAQLFPVVEFTQQTSRAADEGIHDIYPFSLEPIRFTGMLWPNVFGIHSEGNSFWGEGIRMPGPVPKVWVPSLYMGCLVLLLAMGALALRRGTPWRIWLSVILVVSMLGSLGKHTSPIWAARVLAEGTKLPALQAQIQELGPLDKEDSTPIRLDRFLRDGDGSIYWWMTTLLPGFRQFRYPAKLFTFTSLALAVLAGLGWDGLRERGPRRVSVLAVILLVSSLTVLVAVLIERPAILKTFRGFSGNALYGPFKPEGAFAAIVRSLAQTTTVLALGLVAIRLIRKRPLWAGALVMIATTVDLAVANARFVTSVPQSVFETTPEISRILEEAERPADPWTLPRPPDAVLGPAGLDDDALQRSESRHDRLGARYPSTEVRHQLRNRVRPYHRGRRTLRL